MLSVKYMECTPRGDSSKSEGLERKYWSLWSTRHWRYQKMFHLRRLFVSSYLTLFRGGTGGGLARRLAGGMNLPPPVISWTSDPKGYRLGRYLGYSEFSFYKKCINAMTSSYFLEDVIKIGVLQRIFRKVAKTCIVSAIFVFWRWLTSSFLKRDIALRSTFFNQLCSITTSTDRFPTSISKKTAKNRQNPSNRYNTTCQIWTKKKTFRKLLWYYFHDCQLKCHNSWSRAHMELKSSEIMWNR